jgi:hypothetical protein
LDQRAEMGGFRVVFDGIGCKLIFECPPLGSSCLPGYLIGFIENLVLRAEFIVNKRCDGLRITNKKIDGC